MNSMHGARYWIGEKTTLLEWLDERMPSMRDSFSRQNREAFLDIEGYYRILESTLYRVAYNPVNGRHLPGFSCYFPEDDIFRIPLEAGKFTRLLGYLDLNKKSFRDNVSITPVGVLSPAIRSIVSNPRPGIEFMFMQNNVNSVYLLEVDTERHPDEEMVEKLNRGFDVEYPVDASSCACRFLDKGYKCSLADSVGVPTVCLGRASPASITLTLLLEVGVVDEEVLKNPYELLMKAAGRADKVFSSTDFIGLEKSRDTALIDLVNAYLSGEGHTAQLLRYRDSGKQYFESRKKMFQPVRVLLGAEVL